MEQRNEGIDPRQHERLCAWMFGEMAGEERAAFEAELAGDAALQAERDRLEQTVGLVRGLAGDGDAPTLAVDRHEQLAESFVAGGARRGFVRFAAAAVVVAATGGGLWWALRDGDGAVSRRAEVAQADPAVPVDQGDAPAASETPRIREVDARPAQISGDAGVQVRYEAASGAPQAESRAGGGKPESGQSPGAPADTYGADPSNQPVTKVTTAPDPAADSMLRQTMLGIEAANRGVTSEANRSAVGQPSGFDVFSVGGAGGSIQLPRVPAGQPGSLHGGTYRGPGDVAAPEATVTSPSAGAFFSDGRDGDVRARVENFYALELGDEAAKKEQPVNMLGVVTGGQIAGFLPQRSFDPDEFFRYCKLRKGERPRDMFFRFWGDNPFVLTRGDALATFAADVDTASYVLARRYLRDGVLPEKAQIRTEEFVNYFDPDLAPPTEGDFAIHTELAPSPFGGSNARYLLRVGLRARVIPVELREPLALTFVVDTSGSMKEDQRLELVKHALMTLVSKLDARDRIGIVTFSNEARLVLPMTDASKAAEIAAVVQALRPDGSTNAEAGLKLGYELAATGLDPERLSRVVFLSDGVANVGQTDQDRIAADVVERRESGILLNTIGVGMDNHNDLFLEQLADNGDGVCDYVDDARAVHRAIVERFTGAFQPVASDVKIQVEFDDGRVLRWRQIGYENRAVADQDFRNDAVDAGEVGSGHQVTALFELETALTPEAVQAADDENWATVRVRWLPPRRAGDDPAERQATEIEQRVDASALRAEFDATSPGFRRAALVAQFAEFLRRSTHAMGDSYETMKHSVRQLALLPEFATDADTVELVSLVQRAEELGITRALDRSDLAKACDEFKRHQYLRHQVAQLEEGLRQGELEELRRHNDRLEQRIRELVRRH